MSQPRSAKRRPPGPREIKALIAAASVATTLGGWAVFASAAPPADPTAPPPLSLVAALPPEPAPLVLPTLGPLPTVVPAPTWAGEVAQVPVAPPAVVITPPTVSPAPLRRVSAPPAPARPAAIARTRSSR